MAKRRQRFRLRWFVVRYAWIDGDTERRSFEMVREITQERADRQFEHANPDKLAVASTHVPDDPMSVEHIRAQIRDRTQAADFAAP